MIDIRVRGLLKTLSKDTLHYLFVSIYTNFLISDKMKCF